MESNYVVVDSPQTLEKLKDICKIYKVEFHDSDSYPSLTQFGKRALGGFWLSRGYQGKPITIPQFVEHLESLTKANDLEKYSVEVSNERELQLIREHYSLNLNSPCRFPIFYHVKYQYGSPDPIPERQVISFADFAKEVGITPPAFVMTSEDGVPLYEGDKHYCAGKTIGGKWVLSGDGELFEMNISNGCFTLPNRLKAFSAKEAAEQWIAKANRKPLLISEDGVELYEGDPYQHVFTTSYPPHKWSMGISETRGLNPKDYIIQNPEGVKIFSTKGAAETFIAKMNQPTTKEIRLTFAEGWVQIHKTGIFIKLNCFDSAVELSGDELKQTLEAYKSLQDDQA